MCKLCLYLTSSGLNDTMKEQLLADIGKAPEELKVLYIPTAGIAADGAREGIAVCLDALLRMGVRLEHILVYNLELLLSKGYSRTYSACIREPVMAVRLLTVEELMRFDAVFVSGGDCGVLCREMLRTGFDIVLRQAVFQGLAYVGVSAGSMYAAGNLPDGLRLISQSIIPHWQGASSANAPEGEEVIHLGDGEAVYIDGKRIRIIGAASQNSL